MLDKLVLVLDLLITAWTGPAYGFGYRTVRYATVTDAGTPGSSTGSMYDAGGSNAIGGASPRKERKKKES